MRIDAVVLIGLAAVCPTPATAGLFGPSNYDDCILENMKGVGDRAAAIYIYQACRSKFPEKKVVEKPVQPVPAPVADTLPSGLRDVGPYYRSDKPAAPRKPGDRFRFEDLLPEDPPQPAK